MCPLTGIHVESRSSSPVLTKRLQVQKGTHLWTLTRQTYWWPYCPTGIYIWFAELQGLQAETILIPMCPFWTQSYIYFDFYQNMVFLAYVPGAAALFVQRGCVTAVSEPAPH